MKFFLLSTLTLLLLACGTSKDITDTPVVVSEEDTPPPKPQRNALVESSIGSFEETDPLDIDSLYVQGNKLFIYVHYSGGCREHQFKVIGSPVIMKSLPPKRSIQLVHDNEDDQCESIVNRVLEVDLKNLAFDPQPGSTIVLQLQGWEEGISYTFE